MQQFARRQRAGHYLNHIRHPFSRRLLCVQIPSPSASEPILSVQLMQDNVTLVPILAALLASFEMGWRVTVISAFGDRKDLRRQENQR